MQLTVSNKKLTLKEVLALYIALQRIENDKNTIKGSYAVVRNKSLLKDSIMAIAAAERKLIDVEKERIKYCELKAEKDKDNKPVMKDGKYVGIKENDEDLLKIVKELEDIRQQYTKLLESTVSISLHMVSHEDLPQEISPANLENILPMIVEK
jgi:nitroreductase